MERLDKPEAGKKAANMTFRSEKTSGNIVLTVENAAIGYDGEVLSQPINLDLRKMNAVAIVGPMVLESQPLSNLSWSRFLLSREKSDLVLMLRLVTMTKLKAS